MSEFLETLSVAEFAFMEFSMLLPSIVSGVLFWYYQFPMISLLVTMFICYLIIPVGYIMYDKVSTHNTRITTTMSNVYLERHSQLKSGAISFAVLVVLTSLSLYLSIEYLHVWNIDYLNFFYNPKTEVSILTFLLILDAFTEEFFWRIFIQTSFKSGITYTDPHEYMKWFIAFHYGLYYVFIFAAIVKYFWYALIGAIPFVIFSRVFSQMRKEGFLACMLANLGIKLPIAIFINIWYWNKWVVY